MMSRRWASTLAVVGLLAPGLAMVAPAARALTAASTSVAGTGEFADLKVSVSQTTNLIDQVVEVSWTGGKPTEPSVGSFDRNYLQIMQCWGDDPAGPKREQCQFGGLVGDGRGGNFVPSRQVSYGSTLVDKAETYKQADGSLENVNVPFESVTGKSVSTTLNEFYDASSTNELPFGRTRADGTGREFFEVETAREAPGLGCGEGITDQGTGHRTGRSCWLVVVPRGSTEVDGAPLPTGDRIISSPLSATNWTHRIVIPLAFQPIGINCPIGSAERRTVGQESIAEAVSHWQPALCEQSGAVYGFSSVGDALARSQLRTPTPGLVFVSKPLEADAVASAGKAVYAPVAISGLSFAFNIDRSAASNASQELKVQNGERISELNLSARLVVKLLTQSYQLGVNPSAPSVQGNPPDLLRDPDFLALNPLFKNMFLPGLASPLEPLGLADVYEQLWAWVDSDQDAHAFLTGIPDPWGMKINPNYKALDLPRSDLPKSDPYCADVSPSQPPLCTLDAHPYAADLHDAARAAARGDTLSKAFYDATARPPSYKKGLPQLSGSRLVLAITDTASAERYRLPTAKLLNAAGNLVAPTIDGLLAGASSMTRDAKLGVLRTNPRSPLPGAYPLTSVTYAATVPAALDAASRKDYAALLRYVGDKGQAPGMDAGQLPLGYAPLPEPLRAQTRVAAEAIAAAPVAPPALAKPVAVRRPVSVPARAASLGTVRTTVVSPPKTGQPVGEVLPPVVVPKPRVARAAPSPAAPQTYVLRSQTPAVDVGGTRFLVGVALLLGALAALGGPALTRLGAGEGGDARA